MMEFKPTVKYNAKGKARGVSQIIKTWYHVIFISILYFVDFSEAPDWASWIVILILDSISIIIGVALIISFVRFKKFQKTLSKDLTKPLKLMSGMLELLSMTVLMQMIWLEGWHITSGLYGVFVMLFLLVYMRIIYHQKKQI